MTSRRIGRAYFILRKPLRLRTVVPVAATTQVRKFWPGYTPLIFRQSSSAPNLQTVSRHYQSYAFPTIQIMPSLSLKALCQIFHHNVGSVHQTSRLTIQRIQNNIHRATLGRENQAQLITAINTKNISWSRGEYAPLIKQVIKASVPKRDRSPSRVPARNGGVSRQLRSSMKTVTRYIRQTFHSSRNFNSTLVRSFLEFGRQYVMINNTRQSNKHYPSYSNRTEPLLLASHVKSTAILSSPFQRIMAPKSTAKPLMLRRVRGTYTESPTVPQIQHSSTHTETRTLQRVQPIELRYRDQTVPQPAATSAEPMPVTAPPIVDVDKITENVMRTLKKKMKVARERRGIA